MKELTVELTTKCQMNCLWCSSDYGEEFELKLNEVYEILYDYKKEGFLVVRFSGGEPTLYPELLECIMLAKQMDYEVVLLTNGLIKYYNSGIDRYEIQWHKEAINTIEWLKNIMKCNVIVNVVNVVESNIVDCIDYCSQNDIPIHIMKLQKTGRAMKSVLHEIDISITGDKGCSRNNKLLFIPSGHKLKCTADKFNNICKVKGCVVNE